MAKSLIHKSKGLNHYYEVWENCGLLELKFKTPGVETRLDLRRPYEIHLPYLKAMLISTYFNPKPSNILLLGLGGGSLVHYFKHYHPNTKITVIEHSKDIVSCAYNFFGLKAHKGSFDVFIENAFHYIKNVNIKYDVIFVDIFSLDKSPPYSFTDFYSYCRSALTDNGTISINHTFTKQRWIQDILTSSSHVFGGRVVSIPIKDNLNLVTIGSLDDNFYDNANNLLEKDIFLSIQKTYSMGLIGKI